MRIIFLLAVYLFYGLLAEHFGLNHLIEGVNKTSAESLAHTLFIYCIVLDVIEALKKH